MRMRSQRHERSRRMPVPTSMPYVSCRSASIKGHCSSSSPQVSPWRLAFVAPPSYHS